MRALLLYLLTGLQIQLAYAQPSQINFSRITVEQGLSQSTVKTILKDSRGYMWFGTRDGLNRFDGYTFKVFKRNSDNKESLSSNFITDLLEDKSGTLWVATNNGFNRYDPETESFQRYSINSSSTYIADLFQDTHGTMWVGTNGGLYAYNLASKTYKGYHHEQKNSNSLIDHGINRITEDHEGNLWIATPFALEKFNIEKQRFTHFQHNPGDPRSLGKGFITSVFKDSKNRIWVATSSSGISLYHPETNTFTRYSHDNSKSNSICHNDILTFSEDIEGRLWIGTQNGGVCMLDYDKGVFENYKLDINDPTSLGGISIHALYRDDIGNMWVGTWTGGVSLWTINSAKFDHYQKVLNLPTSNILAINGDSSGTIWLGVEEGGLVSLDPTSKTFRSYENEYQRSFNTKVIISIVEKNADSLVIGYHVGVLAFFDKNSKKFRHFIPEPDNPKSIYGIVKPSLLIDSENNLWIGDWGGGLSLYHPKDNSFTRFAHNARDTTALSNGVIFKLFEDRLGNFWVGTEEGLNLFDRESRRFIRFMHDDNLNNSLSHNTVLSIFEDSRGVLWIGTAGGLNLFDRQNKTFTAFRESDGLPNNVINSIEEDDQGNLWLATNNGLSRFDVQTKTFRNFDISDGLQGNEFNRNASYKAKDGTMYFAGTNGFNVFHPNHIRDNPHVPPIVISDLQIFNESVRIGAADSILEQALDLTKEISLSYKHSVITLAYAALNFTNPHKNQYAYKLEGFDKDWNYVGNKRQATYTNLDPGTYTFRVQASNNDGIWNEAGTFLIINIIPPFWHTWWFRSLLALAVFGFGLTLYQYRLINIRRQNSRLVELVDERTHQLVVANDKLSQRQEEISNQRDLLDQQNQELFEAKRMIEVQNECLDQEVKDRTHELVTYNQQLEQFAFIAAHNLRAPVARILGLGQLMKLNNVSAEDEKFICNKMILTAEELDMVVRDINTILEIRKNNTLGISRVELSHELGLIKANLEKEIKNTQAVICEDYSRANIIHTIKPYLDSILFNLISNAIKYRHPARTPRIEIVAESAEDGYLCLKVSDNGLGIDLKAHEKNLFALYKRFHSHVEGKGMGLYLVKTQVEALGGRISVQSQVNKGTTFKIYLKKHQQQQHLSYI